jgi:hypothetical protein
MHMAGHKAPPMNGTIMLLRQFGKQCEIQLIVFIRIKTRGSVITPLDQMQGHCRQQHPRSTRHLENACSKITSTAKANNRAPPLFIRFLFEA